MGRHNKNCVHPTVVFQSIGEWSRSAVCPRGRGRPQIVYCEVHVVRIGRGVPGITIGARIKAREDGSATIESNAARERSAFPML